MIPIANFANLQNDMENNNFIILEKKKLKKKFEESRDYSFLINSAATLTSFYFLYNNNYYRPIKFLNKRYLRILSILFCYSTFLGVYNSYSEYNKNFNLLKNYYSNIFPFYQKYLYTGDIQALSNSCEFVNIQDL